MAVCAAVVAVADTDLPCRVSESPIDTPDVAAAAVVAAAPFRTSFTVEGSGVGTGCSCCCCEWMSEGCGSEPGVNLGAAESNIQLDLGLCASAGVDVSAGTGRSGIDIEERTGVGEGGSVRFWGFLVLSVARGRKSCVPFCG